MTQQEKALFEQLTERRKVLADVIINDPAAKGVTVDVVEKYTDQAHFIYELLQNADDVEAENARFILYRDRLVFIHDGKIHFTLTDPSKEAEAEASANGVLGHINAITSIGNSSKASDDNTIGKFGLGFKAVFQYTLTPYIYDSKYSFKIVDFMVPVLIEDTLSQRKENETAFVFPFNRPNISAEVAYTEILQKLQNLEFPTLFLKNLKSVTYYCGEQSSEYKKCLKESRSFGNTEALLYQITNGNSRNIDNLWLFSRTTDEGYKYSCGFFIDEDGKLVSKKYPAFCFFPTQKSTNLSFIINAPFLLTSSRDGIKAREKHNIRMIDLLATLAADCFVYIRDIGMEKNIFMIDETILNYIPVVESDYVPKNEYSEISLYPFFEKIRNVFNKETILPSFSDYVCAEDAYIAQAAVISQLFSNEQLAVLMKKKNVKWIFPSIGWETFYRTRDGRERYLSDILKNPRIQHNEIIEMITADFAEHQSKEWFITLYEYILENDKRLSGCETVPILFNQDGKAVSAYDEDGNATLFLDDGMSQGYDFVSKELLENETARKLVDRLEIKTPSSKDRIAKLLQKAEFDYNTDFRSFLDYYIELKEQGENAEEHIRHIKYKPFVLAKSPYATDTAVLTPSKIYFESEDICYYLKGVDDAWVFDKATYEGILNPKEKYYLFDFLNDLGVQKHLRRIENSLNQRDAMSRYPNEIFVPGTKPLQQQWYEFAPHGIDYVLDKIFDNKDSRLSSITWRELCHYFHIHSNRLNYVLGGLYKWFYKTDKSRFYTTTTGIKLKSHCWLQTVEGEWIAPKECSIQNLGTAYDTTLEGADLLIKYLEIKDEHPEYEQLSPELRKKVELFDKFKALGLDKYSDDDIASMTKWLERQRSGEDPTIPTPREKTSEQKVIDDLSQRVHKPKTTPQPVTTPVDPPADISTVDYQKKIEQAKQKCEEEILKIAQQEEAQKRISECGQYSFGWFSGLLELEAIASGEDDTNSREVSISFSKIEPDTTRNRTLFLKQPNKNIPQVVEQLVNIPMLLTMKDGTTKTLIIEAAGVQSYAMQVIVKEDEWILSADWDSVTDISINTKNPSFLIREMQNEFQKLADDDTFNMRDNLCENIRFIFGPPGTGKTTFLAKDTIMPMVADNDKLKVLVLTPTNKAADVLTERIQKSMADDHGYEEWLIRYGITNNQNIAESPIFYSKDLDLSKRDQSVVITTMARLPYDYFIGNDGGSQYLRDIEWDYVIVDEASMIPLYQMVYMLYRLKPKQFIVAGDPFQIEPTVEIKDWKTENIYTMVELSRFSEDVETKPHKYEIKLLTTQYRSIESVGEVFSQLTYGGVLKHARSDEEIRALNIEEFLGEYQSLNLIRFPVNQYEGIYRAKHLKFSNYQIYSAIFAFEFTSYLSQALARCNGEEEHFSIGIIAPYGAQAGLIDRLLASANIPKSINVTCGTIHGFQGDECDIVIALFNPPPKITTNEQMFLNRRNIINVAISRAKDYLFVLMPDDDTENLHNLYLLNNMKSIIQRSYYKQYTSKELEKLLFGVETYLEDNSFATGHQLVNVYGEPQKRYEIRSEENAIDVQVHGTSEYLPFWSAERENCCPTENEIRDMLISQKVFHSKFGNGSIDGFENAYLVADFADGKHKFLFPDCFKTHLFLLDEEVKQTVKLYLQSK